MKLVTTCRALNTHLPSSPPLSSPFFSTMAANSYSQALRTGDLDSLYKQADALREKMQKKGLITEHSYHLKVSLRDSSPSPLLSLFCFLSLSLSVCLSLIGLSPLCL
jgi:hypothetical protein